MRYLDIKLSDWLYRAVTSAEVLPISREYFRLRRPIDRRLYELARKHCGRQATWRIGAANLQRKCGSKQASKHFAAHLRGLVRSNHLPDYTVALDGEHVVFSRRAEVIKALSKGRARDVAPDRDRRVMISSRAIEQICDLAPRWDKHMLESLYSEWAQTKDAARNEDARFIGWVKSYTKGKPAP